ncbi:nucleotidyltransferase family protein [Candidatus Woesearchaeota archaeon]|nr:nucleotidyltransferase family protein [Candidatus Woesearchaeota archaeon]
MITTNAILLCAGYATRLYPLTLDKPKPLLPIAGKPMIEHIIERIEEIDAIDHIYIVTNNKFYDKFMYWQENFDSKIPITIVNDNTKSEHERLGAVGDIHFAIQTANIDEDILVVAGDNLFEFSLLNLYEFYKEKQASVVALYDVKHKHIIANKLGAVEVGDDSKIIKFEEKPAEPKTTLAATACYLLTKEDVELLEECIKANKKPDNLGDFIKYLSEKKHVYGFVFEEKWFDIGSHEQLKEADMFWRQKFTDG